MKQTLLLLFFIAANMLWANDTSANMIEEDDVQFKINAQHLLKGNIHYSFQLLGHKILFERYPELTDLDSIGMLSHAGTKIMVSKSAFIVKKPVGFFDQEHIRDFQYLQYIMGHKKIKKTAPDTYLLNIPGKHAHSYKLQNYFDSDDISSLPNSKVIRAVTAVKKLDVISQGASSFVFQEMTEHSHFFKGAVISTAYIPLRENMTLVISYRMRSVKANFSIEDLRSLVEKEISQEKSLVDTYEAQ